ncbi:hypothetical protein [Streptomyces sp. RPT161]|uniref:hypothetical protein n=1 Tax=Streptomyces sp. RPT161 TaxID=3015993 RepID=UPI0022B8FE40|nr:hypothetical protein [Streptomyces sp. RPT161]
MTHTPLHIAVQVARRFLAEADAIDVGTADRGEVYSSHGALMQSMRTLLDAVAADTPARLSAQHDAEFRNLCRAARVELHAAKGALQRLDGFEQALTRMVWPDEDQAPAERPAERCPAAHAEDPTPCGGPVVVTVLDARNGGAEGCEHHAARLLASLERGRVYALPDAPEGAASRVFRAAGNLRPFEWLRRGGDGS